MKLPEFLSRVMGKPNTLQRLAVYFLVFAFLTSTLVAVVEQMPWYWWAITFFWSLLLSLVIYLQVGGWKVLKCHRHLYRIRAAIDHVAIKAGARIELNVNDSSDTLYCYYSFPGGQVVTLSVSDDGVLNYHPPQPERRTEAVEIFIQTIRKVRGF